MSAGDTRYTSSKELLLRKVESMPFLWMARGAALQVCIDWIAGFMDVDPKDRLKTLLAAKGGRYLLTGVD